MTQNQVNRASWPTKENIMCFVHFLHSFGPWRKLPGMAPNGARRIFVPTNPDLADILGRTDLDFEICFLTPNIWMFRSPDLQHFWISRSPDSSAVWGLGRV